MNVGSGTEGVGAVGCSSQHPAKAKTTMSPGVTAKPRREPCIFPISTFGGAHLGCGFIAAALPSFAGWLRERRDTGDDNVNPVGKPIGAHIGVQARVGSDFCKQIANWL